MAGTRTSLFSWMLWANLALSSACPYGYTQLGNTGDDVVGWGMSSVGHRASSMQACADQCTANSRCGDFEWNANGDPAFHNACALNSYADSTTRRQTGYWRGSITCKKAPTATTPAPTPAPTSASMAEDSIRLRDGNTCRGRVEIYYHGSWGTVCDDDWDTVDAGVACKQLGFTGNVNNARGLQEFGGGSGPILFDDAECTGRESTLDACPGRWGGSNCGHSEDAGVDCCEVGLAPTPAPTTMGLHTHTILLGLIYAMLSSSLVVQLWAIFVDHTWCCGGCGWLPTNLLSLADPTQDSENIWGRTPAASKIHALQCPAWAVATLILWIGMPWEYYRGCEMIMCRAIALSCIIHQIWWWRACFGKVDVNDIYQRDARVYLVRTSIPDFILGGSAAYVGFLSGPWSAGGFFLGGFGSFYIMDWVRLVILFFLVVCVSCTAVNLAFCSQDTIVGSSPHGPNDPPPATLWNMTPAGSKICAIRESAWVMSFFATSICVIWTRNPLLIVLFCKCMSVAFVWLQFAYYFGMLGHIDDGLFRGHLGTYASSHVRRWNDFFKWQTFPVDVTFFIMFTLLGWLEF